MRRKQVYSCRAWEELMMPSSRREESELGADYLPGTAESGERETNFGVEASARPPSGEVSLTEASDTEDQADGDRRLDGKRRLVGWNAGHDQTLRGWLHRRALGRWLHRSP
jgi:hypothetical protein